MAKCCQNCGKELKSEEKFCSSCGYATSNQSSNNNSFNQNQKNMILILSQKNQTNAIIWISVGIIQILASLYTITYFGFFSGIWTLAVGIINIFSGYQDFNYSKELLKRPVAIISRYES
ncbi:MAG: zinc ribbon domain-containing protein, partial [Clostridia bacterium]|nr:zinc ribbon domain-containing protein [Clostridia bacterium]